ncbi:K+-transporting ATPase KdpC subunit, partial [Kitasatospora sp. GP30]|uniref:potassium-transporting ATPase subunit C n=1 Tax=Kitasatospora sp. GP30 TaxID=3035084 RepID=UPI002475BA16
QNYNLPKKNPNDPNEQAQPDPKWFQPRPSVAGYDPHGSAASNLGPNDNGLTQTIEQRRADVAAFDKVDPAGVPADALTASGSGLDPHISTAYAKEQVNRVVQARGGKVTADQLNTLISKYTDGRSLGFLGAPGVNVVLLNKALSELQ